MSEISTKEILQNYNFIKNSIDENLNVKIITVSKTHNSDIIKSAYECGIRVFGENYAQEFRDKITDFKDEKYSDIEWHFIGHLQTNKVKYVVPYVKFIHSVDTLKLAEEINKNALKHNKTINVLLQVNTSEEETKFGCSKENVFELANKVSELTNLNLIGLMTIAGLYGTEEETKSEFKLLNSLKNQINKNFGLNLTELSMGMTSDYQMAISEGATMVRIGTAILGKRNYLMENK